MKNMYMLLYRIISIIYIATWIVYGIDLFGYAEKSVIIIFYIAFLLLIIFFFLFNNYLLVNEKYDVKKYDFIPLIVISIVFVVLMVMINPIITRIFYALTIVFNLAVNLYTLVVCHRKVRE